MKKQVYKVGGEKECKCIHHCGDWGRCEFHYEPVCSCKGCIPDTPDLSKPKKSKKSKKPKTYRVESHCKNCGKPYWQIVPFGTPYGKFLETFVRYSCKFCGC